jgi:hypothetical protein
MGKIQFIFLVAVIGSYALMCAALLARGLGQLLGSGIFAADRVKGKTMIRAKRQAWTRAIWQDAVVPELKYLKAAHTGHNRTVLS